ncbi:hypothetical protein Aspvir_007575 [Aspergillus viridinutans]|uniref:Uncharacterized protein n=1 Tax=Aspergillus viridinutans TaxID=75553 RepID=A0A9P3BVY2_ASPVI|nr:uncharacterized protein Aspvir_007575 [Aspergillus viridinutans]GIK03503.1 hypothetical protein Aspvir_007575 [Aspergillus viridinutans]
MPIYDITHYLPIETLPPPETDKTYYTKPILVLIVSLRINAWNKYLSLIRKLQREARLLCVTNVYDLNELVDEHADEIAGFVVTTGDIMLADEYVPVLPHRHNNSYKNPKENSNSNGIEIEEGMIEGLPTRLATLLKHPPAAHNTYSLVFAFEFPRAAAKYPTSFTAFMQTYFGLNWSIAGTSRQRVAMELQQHILGMLAARTYRRWFNIRGVFLRGVPRQEKVLVSCEDGEIEFGEGERMNRWTLWHRRPWIETPDTVGGEWDEIQSEGEVGGESEGEGEVEEEGYLGDCEEMDEDEDDEEEDEEDEDEKLRADCPVAIHEVKPANKTEAEDGGASYVAFVGHLEDSRSMASLILGICGIEMDDSE